MKLVDWLKRLFPKPQLPQKRYLLLVFLVAYPLLQMYVEHTQAEWDDAVLKQSKVIILKYFADEEKKPDPSDQYDGDGLQFGEGA